MDFGQAISYPFQDDDWVQKLGIGVGLTLAGALLGVLVIPLIAMVLLFAGWRYQIIKNVKNGDPTPLAEWDFGELFGKGATLIGGLLVYQIPVILFGCLAGVIPAVAGAGGGDAAEALAGAAGIAVACCSCLIVLYAIIAALAYQAGIIRYTENEQFSTLIAFGDNFQMVRDNIGDFGMLIVYGLAASIIISILSATAIGGLLALTFQSYFMGHIVGQLARKLLGGGMAAEGVPAV